MTLLTFSASLVFYYLLHSLLASDGIKAHLAGRWLPAAWYRLSYNLLFSILTVALVGMAALTHVRTYQWSPWLSIPGAGMLLAGLVWLFRSLRGYDLAMFAGLEQLRQPGKPEFDKLNVVGLNALVRHPLYFGMLLIFWGLFIIWRTDLGLSIAVISSAYIYIGSRLEERKLLRHFGEYYRTYQENVPSLLPFRWRRHKSS
jgi:protein-S-isoprenylcysteine O-methyltransferase Ste14